MGRCGEYRGEPRVRPGVEDGVKGIRAVTLEPDRNRRAVNDSIAHIQGFLIDLDGVLYLNRQVISGACEAVRAVQTSGRSYRFVTNTTRMNRDTVARHLNELGFVATPDDIISPPVAAAQYMKRLGYERYHLLAVPELQEAFSGLTAVDEKADVVVVGDLGGMFTFDRLNHAFRLIMDGAGILALHKDRFWQTETGPQLDTGAFVTALEYSTGKQATVVGKPELAFFEMALSDLDLPAHAVAMVGDSIDTDIGGARRAGLTGILVRTGNYQFVTEADSTVVPDILIDSIADLPSLFL